MVGVFVNAAAEEMNETAERCDLDYLQLSGDEDAALLPALNRPVIKTVHVRLETTPEEVRRRVDAYPTAIIHLDTARDGAYGGTGMTFDWSIAPLLDRPILLAGGLNSANVRSAIRLTRPWGVDVSSGVETNGEKDSVRIRQFITAARRIHETGCTHPQPDGGRREGDADVVPGRAGRQD